MEQLFRVLIILVVIFVTCFNADSDDFYKLLGVPRDADNRAIRKAFKELAVKLHPDKNKDDKNADEKFMKITQAYETLKDPNTRKHYDLYGDIKTDNKNRQPYQSYTYYRDEFGIYDDDPLIVTLSLHDFESNVNDPNVAWFVNFYSPQCWHCHELAPTWRKLASELEGVIHIAAVNCEEDWQLCTQLTIRAYPTLLYFKKESHMFDGQKFTGGKNIEELQNFVLNRLDIELKTITKSNWHHEGLRKQQWLLFLCGDHEELCPERNTMLKIAAILEGLMSVGIVKDSDLCKEIFSSYLDSPVVFWQTDTSNEIEDSESSATVHSLQSGDSQELAKQILALLPDPQSLNQEQFADARTRLRLGNSKAWLICFLMGTATELSLQLKRLPALLSFMDIGTVECARNAALCGSLHVSKYPSWGVLKDGGAFEMHHGKDTLYDIVSFAKDSSTATNLHALSPADFNNLLQEGKAWFIDWYAPWCPPCQRLMPELRRASQHFPAERIQFGTIDCTLHSQFCSQHGVRSYPTTAFYNSSKMQHFHGRLQEQSIVEFIEDMINPIVISLDQSTFNKHLSNKPTDEMWLVDYFAPWCGPCQKFATQWRILAKQVAYLDNVHIAQVDCVAEEELCSSQNIRSYPTIRLYPLGSVGLNTVAIYNGQRDSISLKRWLLGFLPSPIIELSTYEFKKQILSFDLELPWLVDFYAPWCGHCHQFEPEFITVAQRLEGQVLSGKVNCETSKTICRELRISSYPTVMLYLSPKLRYEIDTQDAQEIINRVKSIIAHHKVLAHDEF